jgi:VWFA-related protein
MHPGSCARLAASAAILCGGLLAAQQPTAPTFRSRVDAIEIEMRVADRAGRPVTDLEASDVEVFEDGRRQQIVAFTRVSVPIVAPSVRNDPSWLPAPDVASNRIANSSRIFVLILDDLHVDRRNGDQVKKAARRFVEGHLQPGDLASVVYTGARPEAAQDFTTDPRLLFRAIDQFVGRKLPPATVVRMEHYNQFFRARGRPQFEDLRDPYDAERAFNARAAMGSIEAVALVLARVNGRRKAAILFSEGVDYDLSGLRSRGKVGGAAAGATVLPSNAPTGGSEVDAVGRTDVHSYAEDVLLSVQTAIGAAARANVALYGIDAHGDLSASVADLGAPVHDPRLGLTPEHVIQETRDAQESLAMLATNTGGFVALAPSDYDEVFGRSSARAASITLSRTRRGTLRPTAPTETSPSTPSVPASRCQRGGGITPRESPRSVRSGSSRKASRRRRARSSCRRCRMPVSPSSSRRLPARARASWRTSS